MSEPLTPEREAEIRAALAEYETHPNIGWACCSAHGAADAVPDLLGEVDRLKDELVEQVRTTTKYFADQSQRRRDRAEMAEAEQRKLAGRILAVLDLCDREQRNATRWENPIPVPEWVAPVQRILLGDAEPAKTEATS